MKPFSFSAEEVRTKVLGWWGGLSHDRGMRAELSRATREEDIFQCAGYYTLRHSLREYQIFDPALARTAAVLSRIRRDRDGESFGALLSSVAHESRVKRLMKKKSDRLTRELSAMVKHLKGEAPVINTADLAYWWEVRHPNRDFLYDFYSKKEIVHV